MKGRVQALIQTAPSLWKYLLELSGFLSKQFCGDFTVFINVCRL